MIEKLQSKFTLNLSWDIKTSKYQTLEAQKCSDCVNENLKTLDGNQLQFFIAFMRTVFFNDSL